MRKTAEKVYFSHVKARQDKYILMSYASHSLQRKYTLYHVSDAAGSDCKRTAADIRNIIRGSRHGMYILISNEGHSRQRKYIHYIV